MDMHEKIKYLRLKNNMTLEEVGDMVGVGKSTVRKWENGDIINMRRDKIAKLAKALHTSPAYLMGWEEETRSPLDERVMEAINNRKPLYDFAVQFMDVPEDKQEDLLKTALSLIALVKQKNNK